MKSSITKGIYALLAAVIWGLAFVAQSVCANLIEPFTFNALRGIIAFVFLLLVIVIRQLIIKKKKIEKTKTNIKMLLIGGVTCGVLLTIASNLQQFGIEGTEAGKAGFITALYIVLVPIIGLVFKKKTSLSIWISVIIAAIGLYFLCIDGSFKISKYDTLVILCAIIFSFHILAIDYFSKYTDGILMSCVQFLTVTIISAICMAIFEEPKIEYILEAKWPILYVGVFSSGIAYTLQILAQKDSNPTVISIILSFESVISVIASAILISERLELREYFGCIFMFIAVILAQIPFESFKKKKESKI